MSQAGNKLVAYAQLFRLHRPIGTLLVLWPSLTALWLAADAVPDTKLLIIFCLGALIVRSAGCAINDYADRDFDGAVSRTKERPLASGSLSPKEVLMGFAVLASLGFILVLQLNRTTIYLSFIAIALTVTYPFFKRFTNLPQLYLGLAMNWGIIMAYSAQTNRLDGSILLLYFATVLWTIVYDTYYAVVDKADDIKLGIKSTAIIWQGKIALITACLQVGYLLLAVALGWSFALSQYYYWGLVVIALLFIYHQCLTYSGDPQKNFKAFLHNQHVGWVMLLSVILGTHF